MSINTTIDPEKIVELLKQQTGQISELQAQYKQTDSRIDELKKAQEMVQTIIKPQQEEHRKDTKKEREER